MRKLFFILFFLPEIAFGFPRIKNPKTPNEVQIDLNDLSDDVSQKIDSSSAAVTYLSLSSATKNYVKYTELPGITRGIVISQVDSHTNHVFWTRALLLNDNFEGILSDHGDTGDLDNVGLNGRDQDPELADAWYYVYAISNGSTSGVLYSTACYFPAMSLYVQPKWPAGYTYSLLIGAVRNDASSNLVQSVQTGDFVFYQAKHVVMSDTTSDSTTGNITVNISSYVPPYIAWEAYLRGFHAVKYAGATANAYGAIYVGGDYGGAASPMVCNEMNLNLPANTWGYVYCSSLIPVFNESPADDKFLMLLDETAGYSGVSTSMSVIGYRLDKIFSR